MPVLEFFLNLAGATMLLLFAVRMVQTGVERAFGPSFKRFLTNSSQNRIRAAATGALLAIILQSSTATALLATGFASAGVLAVSAGLAIVLGADLGSALVIQILSFDLHWLVPFLLAVGGYLFIKTDRRATRQTGRILLGISFILISLGMIGSASAPIRESEMLPQIAGYLAGEYVSAFLLGAVLAFVMHSSVASILLFVTLVTLGLLPVAAGISLVLGANFGGALLPVWLSRDMTPLARRIPLGNLILRGCGAILALVIINLQPVFSLFGTPNEIIGDGQILVNVHLAFNFILLVVGLPFTNAMQRPLALILPEPEILEPLDARRSVSALDRGALDSATLAISAITRETLRMGQIVEVMAQPIMSQFDKFDKNTVTELLALDDEVNEIFTNIRQYAAELQRSKLSKVDTKRARELTDFSINLEAAGDIISKNLMALATEKDSSQIQFSKQGWAELTTMHERLLSNIGLSFNVLIGEDMEAARTLVEEKEEMSLLERQSRKQHLKRLRENTKGSFESSNMHLEVLRHIKELNSAFASVAFPILYRRGQLLETRLVNSIKDDES